MGDYLLIRIAALLVALLLSYFGAHGQVKLRNAMDYDGDGKADISVFRPVENNWYILQSNGNAFRAQTFGVLHTDTITPGDYDGDGKADIAVWRYGNGVWYGIDSSTNTFTAIAFGAVGDEPVQRDYDGDGKTDLAIVRQAAGTNGAMVWWVLKSQTRGFSILLRL